MASHVYAVIGIEAPCIWQLYKGGSAKILYEVLTALLMNSYSLYLVVTMAKPWLDVVGDTEVPEEVMVCVGS